MVTHSSQGIWPLTRSMRLSQANNDNDFIDKTVDMICQTSACFDMSSSAAPEPPINLLVSLYVNDDPFLPHHHLLDI